MPARRAAEVTYGLACRAGRVYLVRRDDRQSLMPGMWELPQLSNPDGARDGGLDGAPHLPSLGRCGFPIFTLRHSITVTDYTVHICRIKTARAPGGRWFPLQQAAALPLTGLARRVLRLAGLI
jgi:hypothetical protein